MHPDGGPRELVGSDAVSERTRARLRSGVCRHTPRSDVHAHAVSSPNSRAVADVQIGEGRSPGRSGHRQLARLYRGRGCSEQARRRRSRTQPAVCGRFGRARVSRQDLGMTKTHFGEHSMRIDERRRESFVAQTTCARRRRTLTRTAGSWSGVRRAHDVVRVVRRVAVRSEERERARRLRRLQPLTLDISGASTPAFVRQLLVPAASSGTGVADRAMPSAESARSFRVTVPPQMITWMTSGVEVGAKGSVNKPPSVFA